MADIKDVNEHSIGTALLHVSTYKIPKNIDTAVYERGSDIVITRLPSGDHALFMKLDEFADTMVPEDAPNYPSAVENPINPESTDIKFKAYIQLDPESLGIAQEDLETAVEEHKFFSLLKNEHFSIHVMGDLSESSLGQLREKILDKVPDNVQELDASNLMLGENGRPVLRMTYGGWGQLGDPGGSDAVYTLNKRGINYQLEHTVTTAHDAAVKMQETFPGLEYDVQGFGHSIGAAHMGLLAAMEGAGKADDIMPGAVGFDWEMHDPVGAAAASAVIAQELGEHLYPAENYTWIENWGVSPAVRTAEDILNHTNSVVSRTDIRTSELQEVRSQPTVLRAYDTYFDDHGSAAVGSVTCLMFDDKGHDWDINKLEATNDDAFSIMDVVLPAAGNPFPGPTPDTPWGTDFITGFLKHDSKGMRGLIKDDWENAVVERSENRMLCPEVGLTAVQLANLGTGPSTHTKQEDMWEGMLVDVQADMIIPKANKRLAENGSDITRPTPGKYDPAAPGPNSRENPFSVVLAQIGEVEGAVGMAVKDTLMQNVYGNHQDPKWTLDKMNPDFAAEAKQLEDGGWVVAIADENGSSHGKSVLNEMRTGADIIDSKNGIGVYQADDGKLMVSAPDLQVLGEFMDERLQELRNKGLTVHYDGVSDNLRTVQAQNGVGVSDNKNTEEIVVSKQIPGAPVT